MRLSRHAKNEMRLYRVTTSQVEDIAENFEAERADADGNRVLAGSDESGNPLTVVVARDDPNFVITLWR